MKRKLLSVLVVAATAHAGAQVTDAMIGNDATTTHNVLYDNLVIFGTLDAQLVALDQATGKVVWREKIDDYSAGHSHTAAPLIAEGLLITGLSGGEFGVVGRVEARDPRTGKMVWSHPVVEGHMGYLNGKENGISGTTNASWPGETWKTGGATAWLGGTSDAKTGLACFGCISVFGPQGAVHQHGLALRHQRQQIRLDLAQAGRGQWRNGESGGGLDDSAMGRSGSASMPQ